MFEGDGIWFAGDTVCHRGMPSSVGSSSSSSSSRSETPTFHDRRLLFWYSWEEKKLPHNLIPDIDFQLNPWTVFGMVHEDFSTTLVSSFI